MPIELNDETPKRIGVDIDQDTYLRSLHLIEYRHRAPVVRAMYVDLLNMLERSNDKRMVIAAIISGYIRLSLTNTGNDSLTIIRDLAACDATDAHDISRIASLIARAKREMRKLEGVAEFANEGKEE